LVRGHHPLRRGDRFCRFSPFGKVLLPFMIVWQPQEDFSAADLIAAKQSLDELSGASRR
jgi:hypothetical protein